MQSVVSKEAPLRSADSLSSGRAPVIIEREISFQSDRFHGKSIQYNPPRGSSIAKMPALLFQTSQPHPLPNS